jgi:transcription initiation factor TFIID subunit 7
MEVKDLIRDRTLVLRVLVPSLEARLREKMKEAEETASRKAPGGGTTNEPKNILQDLDGVTCEPTKDGSTLWNFHCDGATYPARLVNLPCPVELHKTQDHTMYYKCVDVAQMLIVFEDEMALEEAEAVQKSEGFPSYYHSGLTPPMKRVVERRFEAREHKAMAPSRSEVAQVEAELALLMNRIARTGGGGGRSRKPKPLTSSVSGAVVEEVVEDIVDFEPWMTDNGKQPFGVEFDDKDARCTKHPELWLSADKLDEIKRSSETEQRERQDAAAAAAEAKKKKAAAKKEARKKVKQKDEGPSVKKGIASKKNNPEVDEVTQAASQMSQGLDSEDILGDVLLGGDFDFGDMADDEAFADIADKF